MLFTAVVEVVIVRGESQPQLAVELIIGLAGSALFIVILVQATMEEIHPLLDTNSSPLSSFLTDNIFPALP